MHTLQFPCSQNPAFAHVRLRMRAGEKESDRKDKKEREKREKSNKKREKERERAEKADKKREEKESKKAGDKMRKRGKSEMSAEQAAGEWAQELERAKVRDRAQTVVEDPSTIAKKPDEASSGAPPAQEVTNPFATRGRTFSMDLGQGQQVVPRISIESEAASGTNSGGSGSAEGEGEELGQPELQGWLQRLLHLPENKTCADCTAQGMFSHHLFILN
jgi:hypothetical protein